MFKLFFFSVNELKKLISFFVCSLLPELNLQIKWHAQKYADMTKNREKISAYDCVLKVLSKKKVILIPKYTSEQKNTRIF